MVLFAFYFLCLANSSSVLISSQFNRILFANGEKRSLGAGGFGEVYLMKDMRKATATNEALVAVKINKRMELNDANGALAEAMKLSAISHPNIVTVLEAFLIMKPNLQVCVVFEYCEEGDLNGYMKRMKGGQAPSGAEVLTISFSPPLVFSSFILFSSRCRRG